MRITLIGGGGSRTPLLYHGLLHRVQHLPQVELILHDNSPRRLEGVEKVLSGIDEELQTGISRATTTDLDRALDGADFVLTAIRVGGFEARRLDESIPLSHGVVGQETVGPGGFALAARNIPALIAVGHRMRELCPKAWMINLTNPAGMATQALAPLLDGRVVGVCDSPLALAGGVADALGVDISKLHLEYAGLNHLGWLTGAWLDGRDLLPELMESPELKRIEEARLMGLDEVRALGALPNEYVYFYERTRAALQNIRNGGVPRGEFLDGQQRSLSARLDAAETPSEALDVYRESLRVRNDTYMAVESGSARVPTDDVFASAGGYHEMALSVVEAIGLDHPQLLAVNTVNRGALPFLSDEDVVEVSAVIRGAGVFPLAARVPEERRGLIERVKGFEKASLTALAHRSISIARDAVARHPLVPSGEVAGTIVDEYVLTMPEVAAQLGEA
ncbi:MAG: 6-phospho-beta-glucosidase [Actinomycetota bacterium]